MKVTASLCATGLLLAACAAMPAQLRLAPERVAAARAALESAGSAPRLRCQIQPVEPALNYQFQFETGYAVTAPLNQFDGPEPVLRVLIRVTPDGHDPVYLSLVSAVPKTPAAGDADARLSGTFVVGEGSYRVELLVRNEAGRVCYSHWRIQAKRVGHERDLKLPAAADEVRPVSAPGLTEIAPPVTPAIDRLTILVHATPIRPSAPELEPETVRNITDLLHSLLVQLPARSVHLAVFNLDQHAVLLDKQPFPAGDLAAVTDAIRKLQLGVVDVKTLQDRSQSDVLSDLLGLEQRNPQPGAAVILLGPATIRSDLLTAQRPAGVPWFYLQYLAPPRLLRGARGPLGGLGPGESRMGRIPMNGPLTPGGGSLFDDIERLLHRVGGVTLPVRSPHDFADALHRMAAEIPGVKYVRQ
jgi:hypothetical protein